MAESNVSPGLRPGTPRQDLRLNEVLNALRRMAQRADDEQRSLTAARAKAELLKINSAFSDNAGFKKFVDLLLYGEENGYFSVYFEDGHPWITVGKHVIGAQKRAPSVLLDPEVWSAMVDWSAPVSSWDRCLRQVVNRGEAHDTDQERDEREGGAVLIPQITKDQQFDWMICFANETDEPARSELLEAVESKIPGEFKKVLSERDLQRSWGAQLRKNVLGVAQQWAEEKSIPLSDLTQRASFKQERAVRPKERPKDSTRRPPAGSFESQLRSRLHTAIDRMSLAELMSLSVPAGYLVD